MNCQNEKVNILNIVKMYAAWPLSRCVRFCSPCSPLFDTIEPMERQNKVVVFLNAVEEHSGSRITAGEVNSCIHPVHLLLDLDATEPRAMPF